MPRPSDEELRADAKALRADGGLTRARAKDLRDRVRKDDEAKAKADAFLEDLLATAKELGTEAVKVGGPILLQLGMDMLRDAAERRR